jgi:hypothetical protein
LQPATGPTPQIHHALTRVQQPVGLVDLRELIDRSRPKALALGALVEVVFAVIARNWSSVAS